MSREDLTDEQLLAKVRRAALSRAVEILEDESVAIPPGQLLGLIGKVGLKDDAPEEEKTKTVQDIFEFLPGLPPERRQEILDEYQSKLDKARKESASE